MVHLAKALLPTRLKSNLFVNFTITNSSIIQIMKRCTWDSNPATGDEGLKVLTNPLSKRCPKSYFEGLRRINSGIQIEELYFTAANSLGNIC